MLYKDFKSLRAGFKGFHDDSTLTIDQIISTEERDDGGDVMIQEGMIPRGEVVVLYQHGMDPTIGTRPIGKPLGFRIETVNGVKCTIARMQYYDGSKLEVPDNLGQLFYDMDKKGFLPNNSIGFNSIEEVPDAQGRTVKKWTLHEFSKVNVGMNKGCITQHQKDGSLQFKYEPTAPAPVESAPSGLQARFEKLNTLKPSSKEQKDMENLAKASEQISEKAMHLIHGAMVKDLKCEAEKSGDAAIDADKIATKVLKEYAEMAHPHLSKLIEIVKAYKDDEKPEGDGDDDEDEKNLGAAGHKIAHHALKMAHKALVQEAKSFKGKKDTDHVKEATRLLADHHKVAHPHAKDFVEKWAAAQKENKFGGVDTKSIAANIAHESAQTNLRMIHEGMVSECYQRAWNDKASDSEKIASECVAEAADLHKPHLKCIIEKVRADNPKEIVEYQKKHFLAPAATNPAEPAEGNEVKADQLPVDTLLPEFAAEQKVVKDSEIPAGFMGEIKDMLATTIPALVSKEIRKAQGKID